MDPSTIKASSIRLRFADESLSPFCKKTTQLFSLTDSNNITITEQTEAVLAAIDYDMIVGREFLSKHRAAQYNYERVCMFNQTVPRDVQPVNNILNDGRPVTDSISSAKTFARLIPHRWETRRKIPLQRRPYEQLQICSIRTTRKALATRHSRAFLVANIFKLGVNAINLDKIEKEDPTEDLCLEEPKTLDQRLNEKFGAEPNAFKDLLTRYPKLIPEKLPPVEELQDKITHTIELIPDARPRAQPIYHCSELELAEMKRQITSLLQAGHIRHSFSPWSSSVLFVKKKGTDKLRMCIDFRHLNKSTVKDSTPIARIDELRQRLRHTKVFTALDMMSGYYQLKIDPSSIPYTAFNCRYGHFEWVVMPFGLCNAPATFSRWINLILSDLLDTCVVAYLDDILIYSPNMEQHLLDVDKVFTRLSSAGALLTLDKCFFGEKSVEFLGHRVDGTGITLNPNYVKSIQEWPLITNKADLASFCGMVNYFKNWILDYADICKPLNDLRKKAATFIWTKREHMTIRVLQQAISTAPVLVYFDPNATTTLYTDASAYAIGGWLGQRAVDTDGPDQPILYYSRKMTDAETRYGTHERELLAIVEMIRATRPYVEGRQFIAKTDHDALKWLQTQPQLSRRQAGWVEKLQSYNFLIEYQPGKLNHIADALSRRPDYMPNCPRCRFKLTSTLGGESPLKTQDNTEENNANSINVPVNLTTTTHDLLDENAFRQAISHDEVDHIFKTIHAQTKSADPAISSPTWKLIDKLAYFGSRAYVPEALRDTLLYQIHDLETIHAGPKRTIDKLAMNYYWPSMGKDTRKWIKACDNCQRKAKLNTSGHLRPLPIAKNRFDDISLDWFTPPNKCEGFDNILLTIDRHRKLLSLIPCKTTDTAAITAKHFIEKIYPNQGIPKTMTVDRDSKWCSEFWEHFTKCLDITMNIATARHQNTNGLAEAAVKTTKRMLASILATQKNNINWVEALPVIAFAYNSTPHTSTGFTPFELTYGTNLPSISHKPTANSNLDEDKYNAEHLLEKINGYTQLANEAMLRAQKHQTEQYNKNKNETKRYDIGELVLLSREGLKVTTSTKYLHPYIGPYKIIEKHTNDNYKLELPPMMRIYNVFHASKLAPYHFSDVPIQNKGIRPEALIIEGDEVFEVDCIVKHRLHCET